MAEIEMTGAVSGVGSSVSVLSGVFTLQGAAFGVGRLGDIRPLRVYKDVGAEPGEMFFSDENGVAIATDTSTQVDGSIPVWDALTEKVIWEAPTVSAIPTTVRDAWVPLIIGNGVDVLTTGLYPAPFYLPEGTIRSVKLWGKEASGSVNMDIWGDLFANVPPTVADSIVNSNPLIISSARKVEKDAATLATNGWLTTVPAGGYFGYVNIASITTFTQLFLLIQVRRG